MDKEIALPQGTIRYREAGSGPTIVFVHGYLVDGRLWDGVVDALSDRFRCIAPHWPMGAQQVAMAPDADLTPPGVATIIEGFLEALDLTDVTLVGNDSGGAMCQVTVARRPARVGRLVLTNCDTHENFPPGIFKALPPLAKLPGGVTMLALPFRSSFVIRHAFRPFSKRNPPAALVESWARPGTTDKAVRHDLGKVTRGMDKRYTLEAAERLRGSEFPLLLAWAPGDRFFPIAYAERLAAEVGNAKLVEIPDSASFVPFDQPRRVATAIADFAPSP
ncbi:MAG TPA: alpha/beta hydrolase [Solirubrobacterales bacterium]|jgi:pimeloyl-ACP methyl ester carboxylesterase|nr:alpha/beta hydrolase [Solirubrobacterales bacterium]